MRYNLNPFRNLANILSLRFIRVKSGCQRNLVASYLVKVSRGQSSMKREYRK